MVRRRTRVPGAKNTGIYTTAGGKYEIGWPDADGKWRWKAGFDGLMEARRARSTELSKAASGERVAASPKLTLSAAGDVWMRERVPTLRPATADIYERHLRVHVKPALGGRKLSAIKPRDIAAYVTRKRAAGCSAWAIKGHLTVISAIYSFATRHLDFTGASPVSLLDRMERPDVSVQIIEREVRPLPLPRVTAVMLLEHKARSQYSGQRAFVFSTRTGRPIHQRDVLRALYRAQGYARTPDGLPTFPELFKHDEHGHLAVDPKGKFIPRLVKRSELDLPNFHALRHGAAMSCDDAEEARDLLRHKNSNVTRAIYRAHFDDKRREGLRERMESRAERRDGNPAQVSPEGKFGEVADLQRLRKTPQRHDPHLTT